MDRVQRVLQKICGCIQTPLAAAVKRLSEEGKWAQLQELRLAPPYTYASAQAYRDDLMVLEFVRKLEIPDRAATSLRETAAIQTFFKAEAQCLKTNAFFKHLRMGYLDATDIAIGAFITRWRRVVADILGPLPAKLNPTYSPGSTLSDQGKAITIPDKMSSHPTCYIHSLSTVLHTVEKTELDKPYRPQLVRANRFFTVPKDSKTRRGCCVEASLNIASQLAVGLEIRWRYNRYYKVDLTQLNDRHKLIAQAASVTGSHSTIDLSNASDTVSLELVRAVLPSHWFALLESLRATHTEIDGKTVRLEKFSSMGNGFTFELETLLFRSLLTALGIGRDEASCFGDDIIVPASWTRCVIAALARFGFTPNVRKTFSEGPFRESCGGDFFLGHDVRAVYLKEPPDEPQQWVVLHNQLLRWGGEDRLKAARWYCIDQLPKQWRVFGPAKYGDGLLHCETTPPVALGQVARARRFRHMGLQPDTLGYWAMEPIHRTITVSTKWFKPHVVMAAALLGTGETLNLRDSVIGYKRVFIPAYGLNDKTTRHRFGDIVR